MCHVLSVTYHVSNVMCQMSRVTCNLPPVTNANRDPPPLSTVGWFIVGWSIIGWPQKPEKLKNAKKNIKKRYANISNKPFERRSLVHWEASFPGCEIHNYIQEGHCNL